MGGIVMKEIKIKNGEIIMAQETKKYNEDYLNSLIAKAEKSWEGVDVDNYMKNLRDDLTDKEDAEKEQQALEDFRKALEEEL